MAKSCLVENGRTAFIHLTDFFSFFYFTFIHSLSLSLSVSQTLSLFLSLSLSLSRFIHQHCSLFQAIFSVHLYNFVLATFFGTGPTV